MLGWPKSSCVSLCYFSTASYSTTKYWVTIIVKLRNYWPTIIIVLCQGKELKITEIDNTRYINLIFYINDNDLIVWNK